MILDKLLCGKSRENGSPAMGLEAKAVGMRETEGLR